MYNVVHTPALGASNSFCLSNWNTGNPRGESHASRPFDQKRFGALRRGVFGKLKPSSSVCLFCFLLVSMFISYAPPPAHRENYHLAWKIRINSGSAIEKRTSGELASCYAGPLPLKDIRIVIHQVTAADKLRDLDGFCNS